MSALSNASAEGGITEALLTATRPIFSAAIWRWFDANKTRVLFQKKILFFSFSIRIADFQGIIEEIAGPDGAAAPP